MNPKYVEAIETRLRWFRYSQHPEEMKALIGMDNNTYQHFLFSAHEGAFAPLSIGETYFMDRHFCALVDHAHATLPEHIQFEREWMHSDNGWLLLETPVTVPAAIAPEQPYRPGYEFIPKIGALGWLPSADKKYLTVWVYGIFPEVHSCFAPFIQIPLHDGKTLAWNLDDWKHATGHKFDGLAQSTKCTRWVYAAMYLMSQRLATRVRHSTDRSTRRRAEREKQLAPPFIDVITLRRKQEAREAANVHGDIDWQWQWVVRGHWREQWYPKEGIHKPVFIESYIKGPEDKPVKPPTTKLFAAIR